MIPGNTVNSLKKVKLFQQTLTSCIMFMSILFLLATVAASGSATSQVKSPEISRSRPQQASKLNSAEQFDLAIQKAKIEALSKLGELEAKQAESRFAIATIILGVIALAGLGGGLALPAIIKWQLLNDDQLKNIVSDKVQAELTAKGRAYDRQIKIFKAHIDIGLAFSDGETPSDSELMRLLNTLGAHFKEPSESLGTEEIGASIGKLADVAFKGDRSHILSHISRVVRDWKVASPLASRRLMEHHGCEILRGFGKQESIDGFKYFCDQCLNSGLYSLAYAWQLVLYDKRYPFMFREALVAALAKSKLIRIEIYSCILEQSKSFRVVAVREEFEDALGKDWVSQLYDVLAMPSEASSPPPSDSD